MSLSGTHIAYFFLCKRKLWLHSHKINCEQESDIVLQGKIIHQTSFSNKSKKEFEFGDIKIDWLDLKNKIIHEVKKSKSMKNSHIWQLKYYLYYFKINNIGEFTGELNYPNLNQKQSLSLDEDDVQFLENIISEIKQIIESDEVPIIPNQIRICKKCSYYEFCYS